MLSFHRWQIVPAGVLGVAVVLIASDLPWNATAAATLSARAEFQRPPAAPTTSTSANFTIYLQKVAIGSETIELERTADGWTITNSGRADVPIDLVARRVRARYTSDWKPIDLTVDATLRGETLVSRTTITGTSALTSFTQAGQSVERTDPIAADALLLPSPMWGPFEALAHRLERAPAGSSIPAYSFGTSFSIQVGPSSPETLQMGTRTMRAKRTSVTLMVDGGPVAAEIWSDDNSRLMRINIPAQNLEVVRDDIASVAVRRVVVSRPGDEEIRMPANGFRLAGTLSRPSTAGRPTPVMILVGGAGPTDRDETVYGIPIFGQLSGMLADAGFFVIRYDKRAIGQSGGRAEAATLADYADDVLAVVATARRMPEVDRTRVAVLGYGEGGWVAMLAAAKKKDITALVLVATVGTTGAELNMWQVTHSLEHSTRSSAEKADTVNLQKRIQTAVMTGSGWDAIAPQFRQQADTPWFKSFLAFDPAKVVGTLSGPLLVVQGQLDMQAPASNADRLEKLTRRRKNTAVEVARIPGVNHLLVPATTGEVDEYATLQDKHVSPLVGSAVVDWLKKTWAAGH